MPTPSSPPVYLSRAKYNAYQQQLDYMQGTGSTKLSKLLAAAPGSGMGRPLDLPIHDLARRFYNELDEIKAKISRVLIIEDYVESLANRGVVNIGAKVTITDLEVKETEIYTILGPDEVDPQLGRISYVSPLGSLLIGKQKGDVVTLSATGGKFRIDSIAYEPFDFTYNALDWDNTLNHTIV